MTETSGTPVQTSDIKSFRDDVVIQLMCEYYAHVCIRKGVSHSLLDQAVRERSLGVKLVDKAKSKTASIFDGGEIARRKNLIKSRLGIET